MGKISHPARASRQQVEQPKLHASQQDLRIDEPGAEIEQGGGLPVGDPPRRRELYGKALEAWIS